MADPINETLLLSAVPALIPLFEKIRYFIQSLQWLVGGMFGLYLILVYLKWMESRQVAKILKEIRDDIKQLAEDIRVVNNRVNSIETKKR